jgi:hypothetical protein
VEKNVLNYANICKWSTEVGRYSYFSNAVISCERRSGYSVHVVDEK